jgi:hypothetical protein
MKKKKDYTIEAILFCLFLAIMGSLTSCKTTECHYVKNNYVGYR